MFVQKKMIILYDLQETCVFTKNTDKHSKKCKEKSIEKSGQMHG